MPFNFDVLIKGLADTFNPDFQKLGPDFRKIREGEQKARDFEAEQREFQRQSAKTSQAQEARAVASADQDSIINSQMIKKNQNDLDDEEFDDVRKIADATRKDFEGYSAAVQAGFDPQAAAEKFNIVNEEFITSGKAFQARDNAKNDAVTARYIALAENSKETNTDPLAKKKAQMTTMLLNSGMAELKKFDHIPTADEISELMDKVEEKVDEANKPEFGPGSESFDRIQGSRKAEGKPELDFLQAIGPQLAGQSNAQPGEGTGGFSKPDEVRGGDFTDFGKADDAEKEFGFTDAGESQKMIAAATQAIQAAAQGDPEAQQRVEQIAQAINDGVFDDDPALKDHMIQLMSQAQGQ